MEPFLGAAESNWKYASKKSTFFLSRRRRFTPNCRRYHRTKFLRPVIVHQSIWLFSARFGAGSDGIFFKYSKFVMTLVHLKIEKYRIARTRSIGGSDLVLTEWTPHRKPTHKMKIEVEFGGSQCFLLHLYSACGAPMPCAAGSSSNVTKRGHLCKKMLQKSYGIERSIS